ncbi:hypothetical protein UFOVP112_11 [uncultured Caudovirales phage]|uniref:Uncharacterized protein n=1 Tax=uncultured Caudovirales phage TaxID=2100421 RepID=A0A6J5L380_9CAUD|nr:hypothetical protein UFOVP112_11 [uncultured Caudovirales phage]
MSDFRGQFIIFTPGRTGSTLIIGNLSRYFRYAVDIRQEHHSNYKPASDDFTCILSRRRNTFDAIISQLVVEHTKETSIYSGTKNTPMYGSEETFKNLYFMYNSYYKQIDLSGYRNVIEMYYEDLIEDPYYLFSRFNISERTRYDFCEKSPYNKEELIINFDELKELYKKLNGTK